MRGRTRQNFQDFSEVNCSFHKKVKQERGGREAEWPEKVKNTLQCERLRELDVSF